MLPIQDVELELGHKGIERLSHAVSILNQGESSYFMPLLKDLSHIRKIAAVSRDNGLQTLCDEVETIIMGTWEQNKKVSNEDASRVADACEQIKVRLLAAALYILNDEKKQLPKVDDNWTLGTDGSHPSGLKVGSICRGHGGITHATIENNRVILLPRITNPDESHYVYADLLDCFNKDAPSIKWIIDCSALTDLPILLLSNLIAYAHKLRSRGGDLYLAWFRPEFIPEPQREKLSDFFHLKLVGGYLFSHAKGH